MSLSWLVAWGWGSVKWKDNVEIWHLIHGDFQGQEFVDLKGHYDACIQVIYSTTIAPNVILIVLWKGQIWSYAVHGLFTY